MITSLLLAAVLGTTPQTPVSASLAPADTVRMAAVGPVRARLAFGPRGSSDSWTHEVGHVLAGAIAAPGVYGWLREAGASKREARWITAASILAAALIKEWKDERAVDNFSGRDIGLTVLGGAVGLWMAERIEWKPLR